MALAQRAGLSSFQHAEDTLDITTGASDFHPDPIHYLVGALVLDKASHYVISRLAGSYRAALASNDPVELSAFRRRASGIMVTAGHTQGAIALIAAPSRQSTGRVGWMKDGREYQWHEIGRAYLVDGLNLLSGKAVDK